MPEAEPSVYRKQTSLKRAAELRIPSPIYGGLFPVDTAFRLWPVRAAHLLSMLCEAVIEMTMTIRLVFDQDGLECESVEVTEVAPGRYRLHGTLVLADPPVYLGDLIEAPPDAGGVCHFQRVVERSGLFVSSFLVAREIAESNEIIELATKIEGLGGQIERIFGGLFIIHVPPDAPLDPEQELNEVLDRVRSRSPDQ